MVNSVNINKILLDGHKKGLEMAIENSIRTGVPLVVSKNGKIVKIKPKFKYVKVPIKSAAPKSKKCA